MGLGVLEPKAKGQKVPGTVYVERETEHLRHLTANLKHGTGRYENVVLVPQPSDSPNDPLNWPHRKKVVVSWLLCLGAGLASGTSQFLNPAHTHISKLIAAILTTPLARIYGKRPVLIVLIGSAILGVIGYSTLLSHSTNIKYIWAGRAIWGASSSGIEYLVSSSVGDLFFVHQRGFHLSLWHVALSAGNSIGQVIAAQIVSGQSYQWAFRYAVILMSAYVLILFFFVPETAYKRASKYDNDVREILADEAGDQQGSSDQEENGEPPASAEKPGGRIDVTEEGGVPVQEKPETYLQSLRLYRGRLSKENYFRSILSPLATLLLPGVAWAAYSYACAVAFSIAISVSLSSIFTAAPYHFATSAVGLAVLSPFVGDILGNLIPGPIADWIVVSMSRRNNGVYEPEFRNLLCIPALIAGLAGYWGFGLAIYHRVHWFAPVFFFGLSGFAGQVLSLISNTYLLDCHRKYAQDGYAVVTLAKGVLTFVVGYFVNQWLAESGLIQVFFIIGMIHGIGCIWGLVLYVYGKRIRLVVHNSEFINDALRWCGNKE
ncbi:Major facilitator superfamily domain, general substrate transporter [Pleurostoma richardsiae]|uniref:Major facilitator superfamily domain, general substrate transporter n=1 Tax=Pleurostoma richardsiae TaxID=41990 RepID=A0AA38RGF4_9PEZI|nr:Major facilitator superfamily domain, general substrate transporter [Pleurostoma richardsiae]